MTASRRPADGGAGSGAYHPCAIVVTIVGAVLVIGAIVWSLGR